MEIGAGRGRRCVARAVTRPLALHWSRSKPNFGDALSPLLCERVSGRPVVWAPVERCDLLAIGSLLQRLPERPWSRRVHVWGSGFIDAEPCHRSRHHFHAVRGHASAAIISGSSGAGVGGVEIGADIALGDPGLLVDLLVPDRAPSKRYRCLVVPHYKDRGHPAIAAAIDGVDHVEVADVFAPPLETLEQIRAAEWVLSSSLHGLIAADALGVPSVWISLSQGLRGGDFKFRDYYSVFGIEPQARPLDRVLLRDPAAVAGSSARPGLDAIRARLLASFPVSI
jgi:hypothetical protein